MSLKERPTDSRHRPSQRGSLGQPKSQPVVAISEADLVIPGLTPNQIPHWSISKQLSIKLARRDIAQRQAREPFAPGIPTHDEIQKGAEEHKATSVGIAQDVLKGEGNRNSLTSIAIERKRRLEEEEEAIVPTGINTATSLTILDVFLSPQDLQ